MTERGAFMQILTPLALAVDGDGLGYPIAYIAARLYEAGFDVPTSTVYQAVKRCAAYGRLPAKRRFLRYSALADYDPHAAPPPAPLRKTSGVSWPARNFHTLPDWGREYAAGIAHEMGVPFTAVGAH